MLLAYPPDPSMVLCVFAFMAGVLLLGMVVALSGKW